LKRSGFETEQHSETLKHDSGAQMIAVNDGSLPILLIYTDGVKKRAKFGL